MLGAELRNHVTQLTSSGPYDALRRLYYSLLFPRSPKLGGGAHLGRRVPGGSGLWTRDLHLSVAVKVPLWRSHIVASEAGGLWNFLRPLLPWATAFPSICWSPLSFRTDLRREPTRNPCTCWRFTLCDGLKNSPVDGSRLRAAVTRRESPIFFNPSLHLLKVTDHLSWPRHCVSRSPGYRNAKALCPPYKFPSMRANGSPM